MWMHACVTNITLSSRVFHLHADIVWFNPASVKDLRKALCYCSCFALPYYTTFRWSHQREVNLNCLVAGEERTGEERSWVWGKLICRERWIRGEVEQKSCGSNKRLTQHAGFIGDNGITQLGGVQLGKNAPLLVQQGPNCCTKTAQGVKTDVPSSITSLHFAYCF